MSPSGNRKVKDGKSNTKSVGNNRLASMRIENTEVAASRAATETQTLDSQSQGPKKAVRRMTISKEPSKTVSRPLYRSGSTSKPRKGKSAVLASSAAMKEGSDEWIVLDIIGDTHENTNHDDEFDCIVFDDSTIESPELAKHTRTNTPRPWMKELTDNDVGMFNIKLAVSEAQFRITQRKIKRIQCKNDSLDGRESSSVEQKKDEGPRTIWSKKGKPHRSSTLLLGGYDHLPLRDSVHGEQGVSPRSTSSPDESQPWPREVKRCLGEADLREDNDGRDNDSGEIFLDLNHIKYLDTLNLCSCSANPPKSNHCVNDSGGIALDQDTMKLTPEPSCADSVYMQNMWTVDYEGRCGTYTGYLSCPDGVPIGKGRFKYAGKFKDERSDTGKEKLYSCCGYYEGGQMVRGQLFYESGYCYEGSVWCGQKHGTGKCWYHSEEYKYRQYEGYFMFDCFHGYGRMEKRDGRSYAGNWKNGNPHGRGTEFLSDGSIVYDGEWCNGRPVEMMERGCFIDDDDLPMDQMEDLSLD
jgi:hypothetical protein